MIIFDRVRKSFRTRNGPYTMLDGWSGVLSPERGLGILGAPRSGKSTLLRMISGVEVPERGRITRRVRVSFPLGFAGVFHPQISGRENVTFVARIYGADVPATLRFVREFTEVGNELDKPLMACSPSTRSKLAFATCIAIPFDVILIDEVVGVGDASFRARCAAALDARRKLSTIVMVSRHLPTMTSSCGAGAILADGRLTQFDNIALAVAQYEAMTEVEHA